MIEEFARRDGLCLAITPEGTRGRADHWKSGFYHIASGAKVPIVLGLLDYRKKVGGLFEAVHATGDLKADMDKIHFYCHASGKHPQDFGPIHLVEESTATAD